LKHFNLEIDPNGGDVVILEDPLTEIGEQVGFSDSTVANYDDLEHHIRSHILFP
jgi:hypothetical protein